MAPWAAIRALVRDNPQNGRKNEYPLHQARKYPKGRHILDEDNSETSKTIHCVAELCAAAGAKMREDDDNDNDIKTTRQISSQKTHARML